MGRNPRRWTAAMSGSEAVGGVDDEASDVVDCAGGSGSTCAECKTCGLMNPFS